MDTLIGCSNNILAPKGVERVGKMLFVGSKAGCIVLPIMDMFSSQFLLPMVIFTGVFGATLMKKGSKYLKSVVLFTKNHWM